MRYFFPDKLLITKSLVVHALTEELVKVEVVLHEELNVARLELAGLVAQDV